MPSVDEEMKGALESVDDPAISSTAGVQPYNSGMDVSGVDERKLIRKMDWMLIPWLSFLFLLSFLDRTSIGKYAVLLHSSISYL